MKILLKLTSNKLLIKIVITILEYLVSKTDNKLDDEVVATVKQQLL